MGQQEVLELGNLNAKRDWGHAKEYVEVHIKYLKKKIFFRLCGESYSRINQMILSLPQEIRIVLKILLNTLFWKWERLLCKKFLLTFKVYKDKQNTVKNLQKNKVFVLRVNFFFFQVNDVVFIFFNTYSLCVEDYLNN